MVQRSRELSFHQEVQFRNILVEYLTGWVQGEILFTRDHCTHEENLHRLVITIRIFLVSHNVNQD